MARAKFWKMTKKPLQKKDWVQKLHNSKDLPKVVKITGKMSKRWGEGTVLIPAPLEVEALMKKVPTGKLTTINQIRESLAKKHRATIGCPITTGIFAWIAAHAAEQEKEEGKKEIAPYWRTLKTNGSLNPKYPGGAEGQKKLLEQEGHIVVQKGKEYIVVDYQKSLAQP
jgi:alkylated DNA nucleotide flippase Atl1